MTTQQFLRWQALAEKRSRTGWWTSPWLVAIVCGALIAGLVAWRAERAGVLAASHAWLAVTIIAHGLAYMRVPFHMYWRSDAALLAQLPIDGRPLFEAALRRCARAALATGLACAIGAIPIALVPAYDVARQLHVDVPTTPVWIPIQLAVRHLVLAGALALTAGALVPAVVVWAASLLVRGDGGKAAATAVRAAMAAATASPQRLASQSAQGSAGTVLGAIPGAAGVIIISCAIGTRAFLLGANDQRGFLLIVGLAAASVLALIVARRAAGGVMGAILRDVSALDRQRLATLEIKPPTALERGVAKLLGAEAGLTYRKDARLMRRRYPMAFALGALIFLVLAVVGIARPADPAPWLAAAVAGGAVYAIVLAGRVRRPPIELPRQISTLPITPGALARAKHAWVIAWTIVFVLVPLGFALARLR